MYTMTLSDPGEKKYTSIMYKEEFFLVYQVQKPVHENRALQVYYGVHFFSPGEINGGLYIQIQCSLTLMSLWHFH